MRDPVRILLVEDAVADAELAEHEIRKAVKDCSFQRVDTRMDFLKALEAFQPDAILSDYSMPSFDGMKALQLTLEYAPLTPFIIWTGSMSEDIAVDCMKAGANNYIIKENIKRLGPAVIHALAERRMMVEREQAEIRYRAIFEQSHDAVFILDLEGRHLAFNQRALDMLGYSQAEMALLSVNELSAEPGESDKVLHRLLDGETLPAYERLFRKKDGSILPVEINVELVRDALGNPMHIQSIVHDIFERKQAEIRYRALFEQSHDAIFIIDFEGSLLATNQRAADMLGYKSGELAGLTVRDISAEQEQSEGVVKKLMGGENIPPYERLFHKKDGTTLPVEVNVELVHDTLGRPLHIQSIVREITERKEAEERILAQEKRFRGLIENSLDNISLLARDGTLLWENPAVNRTLGYGHNEHVGRNIFMLMHPDDLEWTQNLFFDLLKRPGAHETGVFRLLHQNGTWRWIEAIATNLLDEASVQAVVINYRDITGRRQAEMEIQQRNDDLALINAINEAVVHGEGLDAIVNLLAAGLKRMYSSQGSTVYMLDPDGRSLTMKQYNISPAMMKRVEKLIGGSIPLIRIPIKNGGYFQTVLHSGSGLVTSNPQTIREWMSEFVETDFLPSGAREVMRKLIPQIFKVLDIKSVITVPLTSNGKTIGLMDVSSPNVFTDNDLKRIEGISRHLTAAIQRQQVNESVKSSEEFLKRIQNALSAHIAILDMNGTIVRVNSAWHKFGEINGFQHPEYGVGLNYLEVCDSATGPDSVEAPLVAQAIRDVMTGRVPYAQLEYPCHSPEEKRWFVLRITGFDNGGRKWIVLSHENISERKEAELQIAYHAHLLSNVHDAVLSFDKDFVLTSWNQFAERMYGWTAEEVVGKPSYDVLATEFMDMSQIVAMEQLMSTGRFHAEVIHTRKDGTKLFVDAQTSSFQDANGELVYVAVNRDITQRKLVEEALRESEAQYRGIFESVQDAILMESLDGDILDLNQRACDIFGYSREEFLKKKMIDLVPSEEYIISLSTVNESALTKSFETVNVRANGETFPVEIRGGLYSFGEQDVFLVVLRDITERKQAEQALQRSESRFRGLFENTPVAIWEEDFSELKAYLDMLKGQGITDFRAYFASHPEALVECANLIKVTDVNTAALKLYEADDKVTLIEETKRVLVKGEQENNLDDFVAIAEGMTSHGWEGTDETLTGKPLEISLTWSVVPGYESDYSKVIVTTVDITERRQAEKAQQESEKRYRGLFENSPIAIWEEDFSEVKRYLDLLKSQGVTDFRTYFASHPEEMIQCKKKIKIVDVNQAGLEMYQARSKEELIQIAIEDFSTGELENLLGDLVAVAEGKTDHGWEGADETLTGRPLEISLTRSVAPGHEKDFSKVIVTTIDITERKLAETAELEQRALAEALRDTAEILNSTLEYGDVLDHILTAVGRVVPHDSATIMLINQDSAYVARSHGYEKRGFDIEVMNVELSLDETANLKQMLETKQPVVISDIQAYAGWKKLRSTNWLRSNVGAPILIFGEVIGFILLDSEIPGYFTPVHAERLKAFANQAAIAIHNARLLQQAQEEIAERKQAEEELRRSHSLLHATLEATKDGILVVGSDRKITSFNRKFIELWMIPYSLAKEKDDFALLEYVSGQLKDPEEFLEVVEKLYEMPESDSFDELEFKDGRIFERHSQPQRLGPDIVGRVWSFRDITESKQADENLRSSEERFRQLAENIQEVFWMTDAVSGEELYISPASQSVWGQPVETMLRDPNAFIESVLPEDRDVVMKTLKEQRSGEQTEMEYRITQSDGSVRWIWDRAFPIFDDSGRVVRLTGIAADFTERKQVEDEIRRRGNEFAALYETARDLSAEHDLPVLLNTIIERARTLFHTQGGGVYLYDATRNDLEMVLAVNTPVLTGTRLRLGEGMAGRVAQTRKPLIIDDYQSWEDRSPQYETIPFRAVLQSPMLYGGDLIGVLVVHEMGASERKFTEMDSHLLSLFAEYAAGAVHTARLFEETQRRLSELEALYENGLAVGQLLEPHKIGERIINTFAHHLSWHHVTIRLLKKGSDDLELIAYSLPHMREEERNEVEQNFKSRINKVGKGMSGWVVQTGEPVRTGDVHDHPQYVDTYGGIQSGLYMPLKIGERVTGVISVESESRDAFSAQDERLLATLANQAAVAFENARLYLEIQQELFERERAEEALRFSETHYRELADSITDVFFELDHDMRYTHWNKASEVLTGVTAKDAIGKTMKEIFGESVEQLRIGSIYENVLKSQRPRTFETIFTLNKEEHSFEINAYPSTRGVSVVAKDVTERKQSELLQQKRFELMEFSAHNPLDELMQKTMDEICELTGSKFGFFIFMEDDQSTLGTQMWSTSALGLFNIAVSEGLHRSVDQAGVWADAVRQRRSVIHNDFESLPHRNGVPEGHAEIDREMVIPVIRNEKIMAVIGVANKPQDYTHHDLEIALRLADHAWDITERKRMQADLAEERNQLAQRVEERTAELIKANTNLARALRVKDEFLANMSHELRTPLNAILGLSESLGEQIAGPLNEKQLKYITTIGESGHHLLSLINDILDLAKIEAGQITLDINKVDIHAVCQASLRMVKQLAQKKDQEVLFNIDVNIGLMWADERRLKQMIVNLLSNAVKFTPEHGTLGLEVHGFQEENRVEVSVWDNGIGINEGDLPALFQPFVQLDSGLARESTGTGLGLALVSQMARLHGGGVGVKSEPGKGSRFTISLPWEPVPSRDAVGMLKNTGKLGLSNDETGTKKKILLVEDTTDVIMMIRDYLETTGYMVTTARDGVEGIEQAKLMYPDLILMDVQMPRLDGIEATRQLRADPRFKYVPIIALTALAMPNDRERCLEAGMDEYISKPVNLRALVRIIQKCLSRGEEKTRPL